LTSSIFPYIERCANPPDTGKEEKAIAKGAQKEAKGFFISGKKKGAKSRHKKKGAPAPS